MKIVKTLTVGGQETKWIGFLTRRLTSESDKNKTLRKVSNWKVPGPEAGHNYPYKKFSSTHSYLVRQFHRILANSSRMLRFAVSVVTYLIPKGKVTPEPSQNRLIKCLATLHKISSVMVCDKNYTYLINTIIRT